MPENQEQSNNDNDIVKEREDNDIVIVKENSGKARKDVLSDITEYKLDIIQRFMFGGTSKHFGDIRPFVYQSIKQVERFTYIWMTELSEETRKNIINFYLWPNKADEARDYKDYLASPVWKYISSVIKLYKDYTCDMCEKRCNPAQLAVHHCSYAHLGSELNHLEDLAVLCNNCHMKVHGVRRDNEQE